VTAYQHPDMTRTAPALLCLLLASTMTADGATPTWSSDSHGIDRSMITGHVTLADGVVEIDGTNTLRSSGNWEPLHGDFLEPHTAAAVEPLSLVPVPLPVVGLSLLLE